MFATNFSIISGKILALTLPGYPEKRHAQHFGTFTVKGKQMKVVSGKKKQNQQELSFFQHFACFQKTHGKKKSTYGHITSTRECSVFFTHSKIKTAPIHLHSAS